MNYLSCLAWPAMASVHEDPVSIAGDNPAMARPGMNRRRALGLMAAGLTLATSRTASAQDELIWQGVQRVHQECQYVIPSLWGLNTGYPYALALMNYVNGLVSAPNYGYLATNGHAPESDPNEILAAQAGLCEQAQLVYLAIASRLGLPARPIYIWYPEEFPEYTGPGVPGHATVEVSYGGAWHWFDPTWGMFYRDLYARDDDVDSLIDVLGMDSDLRDIMRFQNSSLLWAQVVRSLGPAAARATGQSFMDFPQLRVESPYGVVIYRR